MKAQITINETETDSNFLQRNVTNIFNTLNTSPTKEDYTVTYVDIFWTAISILCRIVNIVLTINLAYDYYKNDKINYFIWTICCFVIPMIVTSFIQIYMYMQDRNSKNDFKKLNGFFDILCFVVVLPFLFRYCQSLSFAIAGKMAEKRNNRIEQKKYYELLIHEDSDVALIRIFECFLEAAPQKVLQISIILSGEDDINVPQILSIIGSLISMAWCIASYHRCIRFSQVDKINITWLGTVLQWLWHFLISVSRVTSIALIASLYPKWTLVACSVHAIIMSFWLFWFDRSPFCSNTSCHSFSFSLVLGIVFIFNYIIPKEGKTRYRYTIFYIVCFIENCTSILFYYYYTTDENRNTNYFIPLCLLGIVPFLIGLIFMFIYYTKFHPNIVSRRFNQISTSTMVSPTTGS